MKKLLLIASILFSSSLSLATSLEVGVIAATNLSKGVDWEKNNYQTPYVMLTQKLDKWYISGYDSVRLNLDNSNQDHHLDLWKFSGGYSFSNGLVVEIGHEHKHDMGPKNKKPESFDYAALKYKLEF